MRGLFEVDALKEKINTVDGCPPNGINSCGRSLAWLGHWPAKAMESPSLQNVSDPGSKESNKRFFLKFPATAPIF